MTRSSSNKQGSVKTFTSTWRANYPYEIRKIVKWNWDTAKNDVHYELWERYTGWRGKLKYRRFTHPIYTEAGRIDIDVHGDLAWAKRTAKRFNLKVPK